MTTNVTIGLGSQFWLANASAVLTQLDELLSVTPPNPQVDDVEATHMASTAREFIAGLTDYGSGDFEFNFIPGNATDVLVRAAIADKVRAGFQDRASDFQRQTRRSPATASSRAGSRPIRSTTARPRP
jgi:hypothetical protein